MRDERHLQPKDDCRVSSYANDGVLVVQCCSLISDMGCAVLAKACAKRLKRTRSGGLGLQISITPIALFFNRLYVVCGFMRLPRRNPRLF